MKHYSDIQARHWLVDLLPASWRPYARLMRLDRPIGTWLLLWPCLWGLALGSLGVPSAQLAFLFVFGALVMRGAGCVINDLWDRSIDASVERTATRPLVSGEVTVAQASLFLCFLLFLGLCVLVTLNKTAILLGLSSLLLVVFYPTAKRWTWWPQLFLGFTFNWGVLVGAAAARGELVGSDLILYAAGVFWTLAYDTIYAFQDKADDAKIGVKSLALYLGDWARTAILFFFCVFLFLVLSAALLTQQGALFYAVYPLLCAHVLWQWMGWRPENRADCLRRFRANRDLGGLVFLALLAGRF